MLVASSLVTGAQGTWSASEGVPWWQPHLRGLADDGEGRHLPQALVLIRPPVQYAVTKWERVGK